MFIRELALECGYNAASLQERIYAKVGETPMCGILIYTAASDSDGTLGGLVGLGSPEKLGVILKKALARAETCSSDPLCSDHKHTADWSLHGAACHACAFAAETAESIHAGNSVDILWTGPKTTSVPVRRMEQSLCELIDAAKEKLLIVSFVAYKAEKIYAAITSAIERGLYMLATILKGEQAVRTTLAIIETYAEVETI